MSPSCRGMVVSPVVGWCQACYQILRAGIVLVWWEQRQTRSAMVSMWVPGLPPALEAAPNFKELVSAFSTLHSRVGDRLLHTTTKATTGLCLQEGAIELSVLVVTGTTCSVMQW